MNIGEASRQSGVTTKMIRYYEEIGLIPAPLRSANAYRRYEPRQVHMLHFVRRARELGFSLDQCRRLIALWRDQSRPSAEVKRIASEHIEELNEKIRKLEDMRDTLATLAERCNDDERPDCPILRNLSGEDADQTPAARPAG